MLTYPQISLFLLKSQNFLIFLHLKFFFKFFQKGQVTSHSHTHILKGYNRIFPKKSYLSCREIWQVFIAPLCILSLPNLIMPCYTTMPYSYLILSNFTTQYLSWQNFIGTNYIYLILILSLSYPIILDSTPQHMSWHLSYHPYHTLYTWEKSHLAT